MINEETRGRDGSGTIAPILTSSVQETNLPAIARRSNGKVYPVAPVLILFDKELIEILL